MRSAGGTGKCFEGEVLSHFWYTVIERETESLKTWRETLLLVLLKLFIPIWFTEGEASVLQLELFVAYY